MGYKTVSYGKRASRRNYSKMLYDIDLPNLIEIQTSSFKQFVDEFIGELLQDVSPIEGHNGDLKLYFVDYYLEKPKHSINQAKMYDVSYTRQLFANVKLENAVTGEIREAQVRLAELPYMTPTGTFIINGAERVIVSQIIRSAGVYFTSELDPRLQTPKYSGQIIPTRGAWVEFELGSKNLFYGKLDRSKKIFLSTLIKVLGFNNPKDITKYYSKTLLNETLEKDDTKTSDEAVVELYAKLRQGESVLLMLLENTLDSSFDRRRYDLASVGRYKYNKKLCLFERILGNYTANDITLPTGEVIPKETHIDFDVVKKLKEHRHIFRKEIISVEDSLQNDPVEDIFAEFDVETGEVLYTKTNIINNRTGEILAMKNTVVDDELISLLRKNRGSLDDKVVKYFLLQDPYQVQKDREGVVVEYMEVIHKNPQTNKQSVVKVLGNDPLETKEHITVSDIAAGISYYLNLFEGIGETDDIDHLGNRRLRLIGELLQNQFRVGLSRTEKNIKDRMSTTTFNDATISSIINTTPLSSAINSFFGSSQLSQFMDQINPLAELTQKRRISALGVGGLSRDRAGIEVRDVHNSHYGRICPIETPEGQSIGLISSLASYSKVDQYGFIQTPYLVVDRSGIKDGEIVPRVTNEFVFLTASEEERQFIASAATPLDEKGFFLEDKVIGRLNGETTIVDAQQVSYMDVSPKQIVSVATATIPFLEHDEASRALMGANMQRQAVPLMMPESPIVGTGVEYRAAKDSGATVIATQGGYVTYVDSNVIKITEPPYQRVVHDGEVLFDFGEFDFTFEKALKLSQNSLTTEGIYELIKFDRSNQNTCMLQKPLVEVGDWVDGGEVIADGPSTDKGELALGRNVTVAFMMWEGYNYEDAVIMCEDLVKHDVYTSVHIEEYEIFNRELKAGQGKEEITREIPFVSAEAVRNLDENGIVIVGSEVKEGDILVGKITPKGSSDPQPAEKLIQAIIGEKSREYRDTSLKVQHGGGGVVQKVLHFKKGKKNLPDGITLPTGVNEQIKVFVAKKRKISEGDKMAGRHGNKGVISKILPREDMPFMEDGTPIDIMLNPLGVPSRMNIGQILEIHLGQAAKNLNVKIAAPVFDGVNDQELADIMAEGNVSPDGKMILYDGRTGEPYQNPISVGVMYMIKLSHMVDDKLHARNVGPYTLVTQQPMGGKAQNGGQRFGEMEVWALYAYGAAHTLQELLTVKSDDMIGRNKVYSAITYGREIPKASLPESFRVLTHELQALGLYVELINSETGENDAVKSLVRTDQRFGGRFR